MLIKKMKNNLTRFFKSFKYAGRGIATAVMTQRNLRCHIVIAVFVLLLSAFYDLTVVEFCVLMLTFSSVIVCELVNSAVETVVDLCSPEYHELAKKAKDIAAGAVLVSAAFSVIIGIKLFWSTTVFSQIGLFFYENPLYLVGLIILFILSFIFIFAK